MILICLYYMGFLKKKIKLEFFTEDAGLTILLWTNILDLWVQGEVFPLLYRIWTPFPDRERPELGGSVHAWIMQCTKKQHQCFGQWRQCGFIRTGLWKVEDVSKTRREIFPPQGKLEAAHLLFPGVPWEKKWCCSYSTLLVTLSLPPCLRKAFWTC